MKYYFFEEFLFQQISGKNFEGQIKIAKKNVAFEIDINL